MAQARRVILGIDPGFSSTGFAILIVTDGRSTLLECSALALSSKQTLGERLGFFYAFFAEKIIHYGVTELALEAPFLGKNAQNFLKLGYLRGVLLLLASQHRLFVHDFAPRQVKLAVTGFGGASKEQVARVVHQLFPRFNQSVKHDATDALAVLLCGLWSPAKQSQQ